MTTLHLRGRMSTFGGPDDSGVAIDEGLALIEASDLDEANADLFLTQQPSGTTGLARRLNPAAAYIACRWDYAVTPRRWLRQHSVTVINDRTKQQAPARPVDWGPAPETERIADLSPGLAKLLDLKTNDICRVIIPLPEKNT